MSLQFTLFLSYFCMRICIYSKRVRVLSDLCRLGGVDQRVKTLLCLQSEIEKVDDFQKSYS